MRLTPDGRHFLGFGRLRRVETVALDGGRKLVLVGDLRMAEVTQRQRAILMTIVERYIETGEPVSSGTIAAVMGAANTSSATVRNEMVLLAEAGLLEQPHTSAGRVPTARAFKMFVDRLGDGDRAQALSVRSRDEIDARFADVAGTQAVLERTSHVLATLSSGVGVAIAAVPGSDLLEHVHFSRLAAARVLAVVVTRGGMVRDRVLMLDQDVTATELETAANFLNENFRGWEMERVRAELRVRVERERMEYHRLVSAVEQLWTKAVPVASGAGQSVYVEGVANLVAMGGVDDRERLREMLGALEAKQRLVELLNAYIDARQESVRVVFELEEHAPEMAGLVLIAAPARLAGEGRGAGTGMVAVIGPKRMQYERTMNAVGYIAQVLERQGLGYRG
jgi:heat-inducible transcriptional repressor